MWEILTTTLFITFPAQHAKPMCLEGRQATLETTCQIKGQLLAHRVTNSICLHFKEEVKNVVLSVTPAMRYEGIQSNFAFRDFTPEDLKKEAEALISVSQDHFNN